MKRRYFLQTLAAAPAVIAVPPLLAMTPPEPEDEVLHFDPAKYDCGLLWVETEHTVYIHRSVYSWKQWNYPEQKFERKEFVQLGFTLPGQRDRIVPDPKYAIPFTAREGVGYLSITYSHGHKKSPVTYSLNWTFNDLNWKDENNAYHRRVVVG